MTEDHRAPARTDAPQPGSPAAVEVRRSARRRSTVSAYRQDGRTIVLVPARLSREEEARWVAEMLARLDAKDRRRRPTDTTLAARAALLSERYLDGRARPASVSWVDNQQRRWGSCTPADGTIRLSRRLAGMPQWVADYVLVHELAHLLVTAHDARFWALVERYPRTERARGFLQGVAFGDGGDGGDPDGDVDDGVDRGGSGGRDARGVHDGGADGRGADGRR